MNEFYEEATKWSFNDDSFSNSRLNQNFSGSLRAPVKYTNNNGHYFAAISDFFALRTHNLCGPNSPLKKYGNNEVRSEYVMRLMADDTRPIQVNDEIRVTGISGGIMNIEVDSSILPYTHNNNSRRRLRYAVFAMEESATKGVFNTNTNLNDRIMAAFASPVPQTACGMKLYGKVVSDWIIKDDGNEEDRKKKIVTINTHKDALKANTSYFINVLVYAEDPKNIDETSNHFETLSAYHTRIVSLNMKTFDAKADYEKEESFNTSISTIWIGLVVTGAIFDVLGISLVIAFFVSKNSACNKRKNIYSRFLGPNEDDDTTNKNESVVKEKDDDYAIM